MRTKVFALTILLGLAWAWSGQDAQAAAPDANALMKDAHIKMYYAGDDGSANVTMTITDKKGKTRNRDFVIIRKDLEDGGDQRYFIYFSKPNDVRRMTFMVWKDPAADDSRWIYIPALDLVKPISSNDKKSSFVGSDFAYEDVSGRHWSEDAHTFAREEEMAGYQTWVVESTPKEDDYFTNKTTWIDQTSGLVVKEVYFDKKGKELKIFETLRIETIDGHPTALQRRMTTPRKKNSTLIEFGDIQYDRGVDEKIFSERYLKSPPREYIGN